MHLPRCVAPDVERGVEIRTIDQNGTENVWHTTYGELHQIMNEVCANGTSESSSSSDPPVSNASMVEFIGWLRLYAQVRQAANMANSSDTGNGGTEDHHAPHSDATQSDQNTTNNLETSAKKQVLNYKAEGKHAEFDLNAMD